MADIKLETNLISGDIQFEDNDIVMDDGLETATFISLFSGKRDSYWGNLLTKDVNEHYGGEFEPLLDKAIITSDKVKEMKTAILSDLDWMKQVNLAQEITVSSHIVGASAVKFTITIYKPDGKTQVVEFSSNWKAQMDDFTD